MFASLNWVDYIILGIFVISVLAGFSRGLAKELISLITLVAAVAVASIFATTLAASMTSAPAVQGAVSDAASAANISNTAPVSQTVSYAAVGLSFALLFAGTILVGAIIGFFINLALSSGILGIGNRLFGGLFGLGRGFILNLVLIFVLSLTAVVSQPWWQASVCVQQYQPAVDWLSKMVLPSIDKLKAQATEALQSAGAPVSEAQ